MDGKKEKLEVKCVFQAFLRSIKAKAKLWCMNRYTKKKPQKMIAIAS